MAKRFSQNVKLKTFSKSIYFEENFTVFECKKVNFLKYFFSQSKFSIWGSIWEFTRSKNIEILQTQGSFWRKNVTSFKSSTDNLFLKPWILNMFSFYFASLYLRLLKHQYSNFETCKLFKLLLHLQALSTHNIMFCKLDKICAKMFPEHSYLWQFFPQFFLLIYNFCKHERYEKLFHDLCI